MKITLLNAIGFSGSTIVPLWIGDLAEHLGTSATFVGAAASVQLGASALMNLTTPLIFRRLTVIYQARLALIIVMLSYLAMATTQSSVVFIGSCGIAGAAFGVLLNITNRILAGVRNVQQAYSFLQITEVCFGVALFLSGALLVSVYGLSGLFSFMVLIAGAAFAFLARNLDLEAIMIEPEKRSGAMSHIPRAALGLAAMAMFFIGQSMINAFMIPIGRAAGLETATIGVIVGLCMLSGFVGASFAKVLGNRLGLGIPIMCSAACMAVAVFLMTWTETVPFFTVGAIFITGGTMFIVPYFLTLLATLDRAGRYASIAPAFLLGGVAFGPSFAVFISETYGLATLGLTSAVTMILAGGAFTTISRINLSDNDEKGLTHDQTT